MKTYSIYWNKSGAVFIYNNESHFIPKNLVAGYQRCLIDFGYKKERD